MEIWLRVSVVLIALLLTALALSGCATPFEQVYCTAAGYSSVDNCRSAVAAAPTASSAVTKASQAPVASAAAAPTLAALTPPDTSGICPDKLGTPLFSTDSNKNWIPTKCESAVVTGAINHCMQKTMSTGLAYDFFANLTQGASATNVIAGTASTIAGAVTATPPAYLAGAATLAASLAKGITNPFSGTPPVPAPASMVTAAPSYAQIYQNVAPPPDANYRTHPFYAGLWNAAGSACPQNLLFGNFVAEPINLAAASSPVNFGDAKPSSFQIKFTTGEDTIDPNNIDQTKALNQIIQVYRANVTDPFVRVTVLGKETTSDRTFPERRDYATSRALAVEAYLEKNIPKTALIAAPMKGDAANSEVVVTVEHQ
jgi:hypothetical protein